MKPPNSWRGSAIDVRSLTKSYGAVRAVDGVSFAVPSGSIFAFLGTNGAGKSTTIGCLTTTTEFDGGSVQVAGADVARDPGRVRREIGVVFQESLLDGVLTVRENLVSRARLYGLGPARIRRRLAELVELIELEGFLDQRYGSLSGGQRRRVDIARALFHDPSVLFLDEPTAGLDPASRAVVWSVIKALREQTGLTVFLTTHYMEETEEADLVSIMSRGRILAEGAPSHLRAAHSHGILTLSASDPARLEGVLPDGVEVSRWDGDIAVIHVDTAVDAASILRELGDALIDFEFRHGRMDDVFLAVTGRDSLSGRRR